MPASIGSSQALLAGARQSGQFLYMVPLWFAGGPGAESRFAIGFVLGAGMAIGTVFTLFVVPALYTVIAKAHHDRAPADTAAVTSLHSDG
jgi:hypothetical protein